MALATFSMRTRILEERRHDRTESRRRILNDYLLLLHEYLYQSSRPRVIARRRRAHRSLLCPNKEVSLDLVEPVYPRN